MHFRLTDVPLPQAAPLVPRTAPPAAAPEGGAPDPDRPYYERGGGTLVSEVRIGEKTASEGTLQVGLATRSGREWGPVRWIEVPVDREGRARVEDLKPGTYRLLRVYRAGAGASALTGGKWLNAEAVVTVTSGKEVVPPALRWGAGGAPPAPKGPASGRLK
jgi:hypothetical protein